MLSVSLSLSLPLSPPSTLFRLSPLDAAQLDLDRLVKRLISASYYEDMRACFYSAGSNKKICLLFIV